VGVVLASRVNSASSTIHCRLFNLFSKTQFDNHLKFMFYIRCHFSIPIVVLEAFWMFLTTLAWLQCSILVSCQLQTATQNCSTHVQAKNNEHYVKHHLQKAQSTIFKKIPKNIYTITSIYNDSKVSTNFLSRTLKKHNYQLFIKKSENLINN
jgi:hypothetical protein